MSKTAIIFAGQGAQTVGMGQDFAAQFPLAKSLFDQANSILDYDLASICHQGPESELTKTENAQPGIFLVGWIAFTLLKQQAPHLHFEAAAGLSLGEFTALTAVGAIAFEDGLKLVRLRGQYMQEACETTPGGMAAIIGLDLESTRSVCLAAGVEIANLNCPGQIVISGPTQEINRACELAKTKGAKRALPLSVAGAYHSRLMAGAQTKLKAALAQVTIRAAITPVISNVNAAPHGSPAEIRQCLVQQVTSSVYWEASMRSLLAQGFTRFIELGPGTALSGFLKRIDKNCQVFNVGNLVSLEQTVKGLLT